MLNVQTKRNSNLLLYLGVTVYCGKFWLSISTVIRVRRKLVDVALDPITDNDIYYYDEFIDRPRPLVTVRTLFQLSILFMIFVFTFLLCYCKK